MTGNRRTRKVRCFGVVGAPRVGGGGGGFEEMASVLETLAQSCASTAMVVLMHYCATAVIAAQASSLES